MSSDPAEGAPAPAVLKPRRSLPAMTPGQMRFRLALAALVALLLALGGVGLFAAFSAAADASIITSVLLIISTTLGGAVTMAFHHLFPTRQDGGGDPPPARD